MVEKMMAVCIVNAAEKKRATLLALRELGLLHLKERKSASRESVERFNELYRTAEALKTYAVKERRPLLTGEAFEEVYTAAKEALEKKAALHERLSSLQTELERILPYGDISPESVTFLRQRGLDLRFYRFEKRDYEQLAALEGVTVIPLSDKDKTVLAALLGELPKTIQANEFILPEKSVAQLQGEAELIQKELTTCEETLLSCAAFCGSFDSALLAAQNEQTLSSADASTEGDRDFIWLTGYLPAAEADAFREAAKREGWAYTLDEVAEDDEAVPTKLRFNRVTKLIEPLFDILGILPGYREQDISLWFLLFLTLFVAMILGDGGYGLLILLGAGIVALKKKKVGSGLFLVLIMGGATVLWGTVTGTWFAMEGAMKVPFLRALVIPSFANYPEYFGVSAPAQQNTIMKFSFSLGAIQMVLGSILAVRRKAKERDLSFVADIGWAIAVIAMYLLSLYLVIGENIPIKPVFITVGAAFVLVLLFGGMTPGRSFGAGLKAGVGNAFTVFLDTISCFGNVMSYIRLFAVGMASLAIAQSFNGIAAGFSGPTVILGIIVVIIGHALNIVMGVLSVVVHGVRLNVLEFSGQVGLEWTGVAYEPFRKSDKLKK